MIFQRILFDIVLLITVITLPWWAGALVAVVLAWRFSPYYEAIIAGLFIDVLYASAHPAMFSFHFFFTALFVIVFFIPLLLRNKVRFL